MVNVEQEKGVAAVDDERNWDGGRRAAPRLIESDSGDRLQKKSFFLWNDHFENIIRTRSLPLTLIFVGWLRDCWE